MENLINGTDNDAGISGKITIEFSKIICYIYSVSNRKRRKDR